MIDYQVQLVKLPSGKIHEVVTENEDGSYTIFIDVDLTPERQREAFEHAYKHIVSNDFEKFDCDEVEAKRHFEMALELVPPLKEGML